MCLPFSFSFCRSSLEIAGMLFSSRFSLGHCNQFCFVFSVFLGTLLEGNSGVKARGGLGTTRGRLKKQKSLIGKEDAYRKPADVHMQIGHRPPLLRTIEDCLHT
jgi:hypothetical protein